jgi:hypothetical protein
VVFYKKIFIFSLLAIFLFFFLIELIFQFTYKITKSIHFENYNETNQRVAYLENLYPENNLNFFKDLNSKQTKIAVFGGSSAAGYGSPINFVEFLLEIDPSIIIHNYASDGHPFVGFQSQILKRVLPHYDYIIIYSGHNEWLGYLYQKAFITNKTIKFPNEIFGIKEITPTIYSQDLKRLNNLDNILLNNNNYNQSIYYVSRQINLYRKLILKIYNFINYSFTKDNEILTPFYLQERVLTFSDQKIIIAKFKKEIESIQRLMQPNQKLIISTVLSNDLFPPISDHQNNKDPENTKILNKKTKTVYEKIIEEYSNIFNIYDKNKKNKNFMSSDINNIIKYFPSGAHKSYFSGISCLENQRDGMDYENCLKILKYARKLDAVNVRILPELNTFIRSIDKQYQNIYIADPEKRMELQNNSRHYLSFFIDFHHPSSLGHSVIAEEIAKIIFQKNDISINKINECDQYLININLIDRNIMPNKKLIAMRLNTNIKWLEKFSKHSQVPFLYNHYLSEAKTKVTCFK